MLTNIPIETRPTVISYESGTAGKTISSTSSATIITTTTNQSSSSSVANSGARAFLVRPEISAFNYTFRGLGKYTSNCFIQGKNTFMSKRTFTFESEEATYCTVHDEIMDYILLEDVDETWEKNDTICKVCYSELERKLGRSPKRVLYDTVIFDHKEKILQIKNNQLNLNSGSYGIETVSFMRDNIISLADELIYLSESFASEISNRISGNSAAYDQILKLKEFITSMPLNEKNEPILKGIGRDEAKKKKYIKLALFLIRFAGITDSTDVSSGSYSGLTASLKSHLISIIQLRKLIVIRITEWLRFLCGSFYEYIFSLEGLKIDYSFLNGLQIEFFSEEEINKLRISYENEIRIRDERIRILEIENSKLLKIHSELNINITNLNIHIENLKKEISLIRGDYENRISNLNIQINNYKHDIDNYLSQINNYRIEINNLEQRVVLVQNQPPEQVRKLNIKLILYYAFIFYILIFFIDYECIFNSIAYNSLFVFLLMNKDFFVSIAPSNIFFI